MISAVNPDSIPITWEEVKPEFAKDPNITRVIQAMSSGHPIINQKEMTWELEKLWRIRRQLSVNGDMFRERPIIPESLRRRALSTPRRTPGRH